MYWQGLTRLKGPTLARQPSGRIMADMGGRRLTPSTFRGSIGIVIGSALAVVLLANCSSGQAAAPPSTKSTTTIPVADPTTTPQTETTLSTAPPGVSPPQTSGLPEPDPVPRTSWLL
jgi:hypothetical protein